jgi:cytochrome d ubiquinol oxidase subunit II
MGLPIDAQKEYTGNLFTLLNPIGLLGGLTTVALFLTHGAIFIALKTEGDIRHDARAMSLRTGAVAAVLAVVLLVSVNVSTGSMWSWIAAVVAAVALLAGLFAIWREREGWAFIGTFVAIGAAVAALFLALFPDVMPSTTNAAFSLTTTNASSTELTLTIMTWVAAIFTPIVLVYTSWTYWTFRRRIGTQHIPAAKAGPVSTRL